MRASSASPREEGRRLGRLGISTAPWLSFRRPDEWIEFYAGWRDGKAARLALEKKQYGFSLAECPAERRRQGFAVHASRRRHQAA